MSKITCDISSRLPFNFSWHDARRYVQTALEEAGWSRNWIQKVKGRKVRGEDNPYSRPEVEKLREAYRCALLCLCFLDTKAIANKVEMDKVKLALGEKTLREQERDQRISTLEMKLKKFEELEQHLPNVLEGLKLLKKKEMNG